MKINWWTGRYPYLIWLTILISFISTCFYWWYFVEAYLAKQKYPRIIPLIELLPIFSGLIVSYALVGRLDWIDQGAIRKMSLKAGLSALALISWSTLLPLIIGYVITPIKFFSILMPEDIKESLKYRPLFYNWQLYFSYSLNITLVISVTLIALSILKPPIALGIGLSSYLIILIAQSNHLLQFFGGSWSAPTLKTISMEAAIVVPIALIAIIAFALSRAGTKRQ